MSKRKQVPLPRVKKSKNTQYRRTLWKFSIPSVLDFVREHETELEIQKPSSAKSMPIGRLWNNPWFVGIATSLIVAIGSFVLLGS